MLGAGLFIAATAWLTLPAGSTGVVTHIFLPTIALAVAVFVVEVRTARTTGLRGDAQFRRQVLTLTAGAAIPLLPFVSWLALEGGLTPLLLEKSVQARFLVPMAVSLGFGVMFATLISLLLVPSLYLALEDARRNLAGAGRTMLGAGRWLYGRRR